MTYHNHDTEDYINYHNKRYIACLYTCLTPSIKMIWLARLLIRVTAPKVS